MKCYSAKACVGVWSDVIEKNVEALALREIENGLKRNLFHASASKYSIVLRFNTFISPKTA